jgi:hypothetical protein
MKKLVGALAPAGIYALYVFGQAFVGCGFVEHALLIRHVVKEMFYVLFAELAGSYIHAAPHELTEFLAGEMPTRETYHRESRRQFLFAI